MSMRTCWQRLRTAIILIYMHMHNDIEHSSTSFTFLSEWEVHATQVDNIGDNFLYSTLISVSVGLQGVEWLSLQIDCCFTLCVMIAVE